MCYSTKLRMGEALLGLFLFLNTIPAQAEAVRLAIIVENQAAASAGDLLTAALSRNDQLDLLERDQIEKVLREQKLSAAGVTGKDFLKLGQILGADGLLLLDVAKEGTNSFINTRLVATKQGVVLDFLQTLLPLEDAAQFSEGAAKRFAQFFPKLNVLAKDAVPISILNLRSAARSGEATETERELTLLLINRLMRERDIFVLERRRMEALSSEKELKADSSPFWNGSYLLEGTIDKGGFSKEQITISARLAPPTGGAATQIELTGKRTNLIGIVDELAKKILQSLQKTTSAPEWKPAEEAAQFFDEAKWALKWGMAREAQAAADSAWALGKRDLDTAQIRVRSYLMDCGLHGQIYMNRVHYDSTGPKTKVTRQVSLEVQPDPRKIDAVFHTLNLYYEFSQTLAPEEPKRDTPWYFLGINVLDAAGAILQHFHFDLSSQAPVADKLTGLRALARATSAWMLKSSSVREIYWLDDRTVSPDTFNIWFQRGTVQSSLASVGRFWQERPEDCLALYRELMSGEGYHRVRKYLLTREQQSPILTGWTAGDRQRVAGLWQDFLRELESSTNLVLQIEGKFQRFADANPDNEGELERAFDALRATILTNREALVRAKTEVFQSYDISSLISHKCADIQTPEKERIKKRYYPEFDAQLRSIRDDFWKNMEARMSEQKNAEGFAKQKKYLEQKTPYDFHEFVNTFSGLFRYSPEQARELQPLLSSYKVDYTAQLEGKSGREKSQIQSVVTRIQLLEKQLDRALAAPASSTNKPVAVRVMPVQYPEPKLDPATNVIIAKRFFRIPVERLEAENLRVFAHRYSEGKLLLDLRYEQAEQTGTRSYMASVGIWNPKNELADFIPYPDGGNHRGYIGSMFGEPESGLHVEIFKEAVYVAGWNDIQKFDLKSRKWQALAIPVQTTAQLFAVHGRLFATTGESIFELLDGGQSTRILASTRRRPSASDLDSLESFGKPVLFPGPNGSIRTLIGKIYTWDGNDWSGGEEIAANNLPRVFEDGTLFKSHSPQRSSLLWILPHQQNKSELCVVEAAKEMYPNIRHPGFLPNMTNQKTNSGPRPVWENIGDFSLAGAAAATLKSNLYFFVEHVSVETNAAGKWTFEEKDGRHANLICLDREFSKPLVVPLKFDLARGPFASQSLRGRIHGWVGQAPYWLVFTPEDLIVGQGNLPGCWVIPRNEIDAVLAVQKQIQRHGNLEKAAAAQKRKQDLLAKYDDNRDGVFSGNEKEKMINDPAWFEDQWPFIDTNGNGFLDAEDNLLLFDANENGMAEAGELSAMEKIQLLVSGELLQRFDANGDGFLGEEELRLMAVKESENPKTQRMYFSYSSWNIHDKNPDRRLDKKELESMLIVLTRNSIFAARPMRPDMRPGMPSVMMDWEKEQTKTLYKMVIEYFWQQNKAKSSAVNN